MSILQADIDFEVDEEAWALLFYSVPAFRQDVMEESRRYERRLSTILNMDENERKDRIQLQKKAAALFSETQLSVPVKEENAGVWARAMSWLKSSG